MTQFAFLHHSCLQPPVKQTQDPTVFHHLPHELHQDFLVYMVKETLDVQIHRIDVSLLTQGFYPLRRCLGASSRAKSVAVFVEIFLENGTENIMRRLLTCPISYCGNAERSPLCAPRLGNITPQCRFASVRVPYESPA